MPLPCSCFPGDIKMSFFISNISTLLLNNISNIHSEIIIQPDIRSYCFDFKQGKRKWLHVSGWFLELIFSRVWNRFWTFAVSLLNSVFALWLIEYFDVKSIVLRLFCFVFSSSKSFKSVPFRWGFWENTTQEICSGIFPGAGFDQGLYFSIPLNAFILSRSPFNVTLKMSIPF